MANDTIDKIIADLRRVEQIITTFREAGKVPDIERDIVLAKLRNVYEFIQFLEVEKAIAVPAPETAEAPVHVPEAVSAGTVLIREAEEHTTVVTEMTAAPQPTAGVEITPPRPPEIPVPAPSEPNFPHPSEIPVRQPAEVPVQKPQENPAPKPDEKPLEHKVQVHARKVETTTILAEKFQQNGSFLNEALAKYQNHSDISRKFQTKPIQDIFAAISLNEKYLYIKELFNNDPTVYKSTIETLNSLQDFNQAVSYIDQHFNWDFNDFQVQKMLELIHRRYLPVID